MTVSAQTPIKRSTANGVTTVFPYDFKILAAADLEVSLDGVVKTLTTDYTLSGVGDDAGGNVTMLSAPANGAIVVRRRNMAYTREVDYQDQGELPTDTLDDDQDAPILMIQQVAEGLSRAVSLPPESSGVSLELPTPGALQYLRWNAAADALESVLLADVSLISLTAYAQTLLNAVDAAAARVVLGITTFGSSLVTAANAAAARTAMGAAASGANNDITSLKIGVQGTFAKFTADAIGVNNYNCVISAAGVMLKNSVDQYLSVKTVSLTINANGTVGAPLSIMSARTASTWYYRWIWYNATLGVTATLDTSSSAPTAPTGYASTDFNALMPGACRTDASGSTYLLQTKTRGKNSSYTVLAGSNTAALRVMASGALGDPTTPTWSAVAVDAFVPPTATAITAVLSTDTTNVLAIVAPSNAYGGRSSASNLPPMTMNSYLSAAGVGSSLTMELESTNIYYASSGAAYLLVSGWRDEV